MTDMEIRKAETNAPAAEPGVDCITGEPPVEEAGKPWVVFFGEDWGRLNSTGQYLAAALTSSHRVLWVNSLGLRAPRLTLADARRSLSKLRAFAGEAVSRRRGKQQDHDASGLPDGLTVVSPLAMPWLARRGVRRFNRWFLGRWLRRLQGELGIRAPVVISACPATADIMEVLQPRRTIYYCADEHAELPGMDGALVRRLEADLMRRCDLVLATSRALQRGKAAMHPDVRYFPHGVCFGHLNQAVRLALACPRDLLAISRPRVGYVGLVGQHLDLALLAEVARRLPAVSFVLIGPVEEGLDGGLPRLPNLHYLGPRAYARVPAYLARFELGLLPWNQGQRNRYAHPTKLREYLAAGCAVVSTPHPEVTGVSSHVSVAGSASGFAAAIQRRLDPAAGDTRSAIAAPMAAHDWSARASQLQAMLAVPSTNTGVGGGVYA